MKIKNYSLIAILSEAVPFLLLLLYIIAVVVIKLYLPPAEEIIATISGFYGRFGYPFIFFSGLLESMFLVGFYFPGSAAILLGAALAKAGVVFLPFIIIFGTLGLMFGYTINYFLGKYGWYKVLARFGLEKGIDMAGEKLKKHGVKAIFLGSISPNSASLLSTAAGVTGYPFHKFFLISFISQSFWSITWGSIAYIFGNLFIEGFIKYSQYIVLLIILILIVIQLMKRRKKE